MNYSYKDKKESNICEFLHLLKIKLPKDIYYLFDYIFLWQYIYIYLYILCVTKELIDRLIINTYIILNN